jgi:hypothetical protein
MKGKKIKITESQLKRLVSNRKQISEDESINEIGVGSVEMGLAKEIAPIIVAKLNELGAGDMGALDMGIFARALQHEIANHKVDTNDDMSDDMDSEPSDDEMSNQPGWEGGVSYGGGSGWQGRNESVEKIKSQFQRFL